MMHAHMFKESAARSRVCPMCGIPTDSQYFDESKVAAAPAVGREVLLAHFELPPQYCGVLEYFAPLQVWLEQQNRGKQCGW